MSGVPLVDAIPIAAKGTEFECVKSPQSAGTKKKKPTSQRQSLAGAAGCCLVGHSHGLPSLTEDTVLKGDGL